MSIGIFSTARQPCFQLTYQKGVAQMGAQPKLSSKSAQRPFLRLLGTQALHCRGYRRAAPLNVLQAATDAATQGGGSPPQPPSKRQTDQDPEPQGLPVEAYILAWTRNPLAMLLQHLGGLVAVATAVRSAVQWCFQTTQAATKQSVLSWTGESRVITKGDLSSAFAEATSVQKGAERLLLKSDLDGLEQRLSTKLDGFGTKLDGFGTRLDGIDRRLDGSDKTMFRLCGCGVVLLGVMLWAIFRKK